MIHDACVIIPISVEINQIWRRPEIEFPKTTMMIHRRQHFSKEVGVTKIYLFIFMRFGVTC